MGQVNDTCEKSEEVDGSPQTSFVLHLFNQLIPPVESSTIADEAK